MSSVYKTIILSVLITLNFLSNVSAQSSPYYPVGVALTGDSLLLVANKGKKSVDIVSLQGQLQRSYRMEYTPTGAIGVGNEFVVTTMDKTGRVLFVDKVNGAVKNRLVTGSGTCSPIVSPCGEWLYVCNQFQNTVSKISVKDRVVVGSVSVLREPRVAAISKNGKYLYVANFLPAQRADVDYVAGAVSVIDLTTFTKVKDIQLANGSNALRDICVTPDDRYIYISHNLGRFSVPTSQLQQGWMNTSAFSIVDGVTHEYLGVVLVDEPERGAAGVWGIECDNEKIYVSHSGTHEISVINQADMLKRFLAYKDKSLLEYDLNFLYGIRKRIPLQGNGPRDMLLANGKLIIPTYFSDILNVFDTNSGKSHFYELNPGRVESNIDKGERFFNDATRCFQGWQSCNGCHPGDGRMDAMNWDLMNDGVGNSKNCKSLLYSHVTPPCMISGIRAHAELAVRAGYRLIQFFDISEDEAKCVDEYLMSLKPVPSPHLINGEEMSELAKKGEKVFNDLKCGDCHSGVYFTDMKMYRIGQDIEFQAGWDTPTLREVWRTAPYLFDGRAATMKEVFTEHKHGIEKRVSQKDIDALVEYVNSL